MCGVHIGLDSDQRFARKPVLEHSHEQPRAGTDVEARLTALPYDVLRVRKHPVGDRRASRYRASGRVEHMVRHPRVISVAVQIVDD